MPERTTEDYEGMPSVKVQQAIHAILNDDSTRESIPINTLINFNDNILDDYGTDKDPTSSKSRLSTSASSARPKSSKRPKSAKKKKNE